MKMHTKERTNVSIDGELLEQARSEKLVLSALLEDAIKRRLKETAYTRWLEKNKDAIGVYNRDIEEHGVFSDGLRSF
ncbi:MAG: type II toxin-antitoxin system CcdA family antitoxin [Treponemataceae bacterium]